MWLCRLEESEYLDSHVYNGADLEVCGCGTCEVYDCGTHEVCGCASCEVCGCSGDRKNLVV